MMKRRMVNVMTTSAMVAMMTAAMAMPVFAVDTPLVEVTNVKLTKNVTTDADTYAPNTEFQFTIDTAEAVAATGITNALGNIEAGIEGGLSIDYGNGNTGVAFAPDTTKDTAETYTNDTAVIKVDKTQFKHAGVYHYTIKENIPTIDAEKYAGIKYDDKTRDIYVTILNGNDGLYCAGVKASTDKGATKTDFIFNNDYGKDNDTTHDVLVKKTVTGNQADMTQAFDFDIQVNADEIGEIFKIRKMAADGAESLITVNGAEIKSIASGTSITVALKDGESVKIYGLTSRDNVSILENQKYASTDYGYTVTKTFDDANKIVTEETEVNNGINGTVSEDGTAATVKNDKNITTPTGIALATAPYALMVALAGVFGFSFFRKKREEI